jgi:LPXTG-motif cell wall-anchored protein
VKRCRVVRFRLRLVVALLLSAALLTVGLCWRGDGSLSWAAPGQNPHLQTVPPRPPTSEPEPTSAPPHESPGDDDRDDDDDAGAPPTPSPVAEDAPTTIPTEAPLATASPTPAGSPMSAQTPAAEAPNPTPTGAAVSTAATATSGGENLPVTGQAKPPYWLLALGLGLLLVMSGVFLARRFEHG